MIFEYSKLLKVVMNNTSVTTNLPKIQESWVFYNSGYIFTIKRKAFRNYRLFNLEDHLFEVSVKLLDGGKKLKLIDILGDMRSGLAQMIEGLQDIYKNSDRQSQIYLFFDDEKTDSFAGVASGNYKLFPVNPADDQLQAKKIAINGLGLLKTVLQSHQKIDLTENFSIKVTVLHKHHLEKKRKAGTLKEPVFVD